MVVMYHDIVADGSRHRPDCVDLSSPTESEFAAHVDAIARRYPIMTLRDGFRALRAGTLDDPAVAITFDDGYEAVYTRALPILERHAVPATVFVLTGWVNGTHAYWWHELHQAVRRADAAVLGSHAFWRCVADATGAPPPSPAPETGLRPWACAEIENRLRPLPAAPRSRALARIVGALPGVSATDETAAAAMTWAQIKSLVDHGFELGAHTLSHPNLRDTTPGVAESEIVGSREEIQRRTGHDVVGFAYPYGKDVDGYGDAARILGENGFEYACTTATGVNSPESDPYLLRRVSLPIGGAGRGLAAHLSHLLTR